MAIKVIDIVCHTHTDFGYTDYPLKAGQLLKQYVGDAIDAAERTAHLPENDRFHWTLEALLPVREWWQDASECDRKRLLSAIDRGQIEVMGLPFNITAFLNEDEWDYMLRWIPRALWDRMHITTAMQNDINGLHTAGMAKAYDAGIHSVWIGPNNYNGAPPVPNPILVDWNMDESRTMRVWINAGYNDAYYLFYDNWRQGPVPQANDLRYRRPSPADFFRTDDAFLLEAHRHCHEKLRGIVGEAANETLAAEDGFTKNRVFGGYPGEVLAVSLTNQWRMDNDPPCAWISDFVHAWNKRGLQPELRLRTASQAMKEVADGWRGEIQTLSGEWTDWWANGTASSPVELAYTRQAKRNLRIAKSPVFGAWDDEMHACADEILYNLCMYDEHTFGAWQSVADPDSFQAKAQRAEKNIYAYRACAYSADLLGMAGQRLEVGLHNEIRVVNPTSLDRTYPVTLPVNCLRGEYRSLVCETTGTRIPLRYINGISNFMRPGAASDLSEENISRTFSDSAPDQAVQFSVSVPAYGSVILKPTEALCETPATVAVPYTVTVDALGWPCFVKVGEHVLIDGTMGAFRTLQADGFSPRWTLRDIFDTDDAGERARLYNEHTRLTEAVYNTCVRSADGTDLTFEQSFSHPSLRYGKRILRIHCTEGTATLTVRFYRESNMEPELYYIAAEAPRTDGEVHISNTGKPFRPGLDQLEGCCKDYYAIDGWVHHGNRENGYMISSRDAALVTFDTPTQPSRRETAPTHCDRMFFQVFDNTWDTNFNANAFGMMSFTFDIAAGIALSDCESISGEMAAEPVVIVRMGMQA